MHSWPYYSYESPIEYVEMVMPGLNAHKDEGNLLARQDLARTMCMDAPVSRSTGMCESGLRRIDEIGSGGRI
jgi:hypothetical protein